MKLLTIKNLIVGAGVILLPLLFFKSEINSAQDGVRWAKQIGLFYLAAVVVSLIVNKSFGKEVALIIGFILFNVITSGFGYLQQCDAICVLASLSIGYCFLNRRDDFHLFYFDLLVAAGIISSVMGYMQIADKDPLWTYVPGVARTLPTAFMGQHTILGPFLDVCAVAALFRKRYFCFAFIVPVILATESSFSYLSLGVGTFIYLWTILKRSTIVYITLAGLVAVFVASMFKDLSYFLANNGRYEIWTATIQCWKEFPLFQKIFGFGFGSYKALFPMVQPFNTKQFGVFIHAHNEYLQLLFEGGVAGIAVLLYSLKGVFTAVCKAKETHLWGHFAIFMVFMSNAIGNFPFHVSPHGVLALCSFIVLVSPRSDALE